MSDAVDLDRGDWAVNLSLGLLSGNQGAAFANAVHCGIRAREEGRIKSWDRQVAAAIITISKVKSWKLDPEVGQLTYNLPGTGNLTVDSALKTRARNPRFSQRK
ncbi:hypothetical protein FB45DRAFT_1004958 [Roridomyces roridus]|uniref:Uncharacterized protein n=1 Tax=Roridomyces roridus TaxID=1738132 RepID=A0AAD7BMH8_9AGAR|nr:hypothetical protein FB45DRAFT_1004958 [Roridomyces roridus]